MFVALFECLFVLRGALSYPGGVGAVARPVPGSEAGGPGGLSGARRRTPRSPRGVPRVPGGGRGPLEAPERLPRESACEIRLFLIFKD